MKVKNIFFAVLLLFTGCSKQQDNLQVQQSSIDDVAIDPTANLTPLNDLGTRTFKGYVGGLYPNGENAPSGTYADDLLAISNTIVPLDTAGNPKSFGQVLFISLGASTASDNMTTLRLKTVGNPLTYSKLHLLNCCQAKTGVLSQMSNPNSDYWKHVLSVMKKAKAGARQVQVIYMETDDSLKLQNFPDRAIEIKNRIKAAMLVMKQKCPNLKVLYLNGRTRSFGNNTDWNREPSPHYFGWACKWLIGDQIDGVPGTEYKGPNPVAPIATWGFYEWAKTTPRTTDGYAWLKTESTDGLHATPAGLDSIARRFQNFLLTDPYASKWYAAH
jgi:hypothetical protein